MHAEAVMVEMVSEGGVGAAEAAGSCGGIVSDQGTACEMSLLQEGALHIKELKGDI